MNRRRRTVRNAAILLALLIVLIGTCAWQVGTILSDPAPARVGALPKDLHGREITFRSASGSQIHGWLLPGRRGSGVVILLHGIRGSRVDMLSRAHFLSAAGFGILMFDFQAHGESPGKHITFGYLESRDVQAAVDVVKQQMPRERIGIIGVSLGGAAAVLASPPLPVDAMVLEMVYPTIDEAISDRLDILLGSSGRLFTPLLSVQLRPRLDVTADQLRPIDRVGTLTMPKLFIAGAEDRHTTLAESRRLFAAAAEPKELWIIPGAAHTNLYLFAPDEYRRRVVRFLTQALRPVAGATPPARSAERFTMPRSRA